MAAATKAAQSGCEVEDEDDNDDPAVDRPDAMHVNIHGSIAAILKALP